MGGQEGAVGTGRFFRGTWFAFAVVAADFAAVLVMGRLTKSPVAGYAVRAVLAAAAIGICAWARGPSGAGLGLGNFRKGMRDSAAVAAAVAFLLAMGYAAAWLLKNLFDARLVDPGRGSPITAGSLLLSCAVAPLVEEAVYRGVLFPPLFRSAGWPAAIVVSGIVFQGLHAAYGIWFPHYFFGGMILAWSFMRSGSLVFPVVLHSLWNLAMLIFWALAHDRSLPLLI